MTDPRIAHFQMLARYNRLANARLFGACAGLSEAELKRPRRAFFTSIHGTLNHLLVVGFYLINLGYVSLALKLGYVVLDARTAIEALSWKVGFVLVVLGAMHFFNLYVFSRIRRRATLDVAPPPIQPDSCLASAPKV